MSLTSKYSRLRKAAEQRANRLEAAGFSARRFDRVADIKPENLKSEISKIKRWLDRPDTTVKGARKAKAEKEERAEAQRQRRNEKARERRAQQKASMPPKPKRSKMSEEERKARHREQQRAYYRRQKDLKELNAFEIGMIDIGPNDQALRNLLSGLRKWGITVRSIADLKRWAEYIKERKADSERGFYEFDIYIEDLKNQTGKDGGTKNPITAADIENVMRDFTSWMTNNETLEDMYFSRQEGETAKSSFDGFWRQFMRDQDNREV